MQGQPKSMQHNPVYDDVVADVRGFLSKRIDACVQAGIDISRLIIDPGFGFGKTQQQNFTLLNELERIRKHDLPILVGLSRKSVIGQTLGLAVDERTCASIALALLAVMNGANIVRVHDVKETSQAIRMLEAVLTEKKGRIQSQ
jgi:dihydropteroate synthase